jgi:hypothetical protein
MPSQENELASKLDKLQDIISNQAATIKAQNNLLEQGKELIDKLVRTNKELSGMVGRR